MFHDVRADQLFVWHQLRAVIRNGKGSKGALRAGMFIFELLRFCGFCQGVLVDDMHLHFFKQRGVAVGQTHLEVVRVVRVFVNHPSGSGPNVVLRISNRFAINLALSAATNTEIHQRGIVPDWQGPLTRLQNRDRDLNARRQTVTYARQRVHHARYPSSVCRRGQARKPLDLRFDRFLWNHHGRDEFNLFLRRSCAIRKVIFFWFHLSSSLESSGQLRRPQAR